jgi:hypothetical protein
MNDDITRLLAQGDPPAPATIEKIAARLAAAKPVRALPSNFALWAIAFGVFTALALLVAAAVRWKAVAVLGAGRMAAYYGVLFVLAALFSRATIERMIPGAKRIVPAAALLIAAPLVLGLLAVSLFADRGVANFVSLGIPCLRLGLISAVIGGVLGWRLLHCGYLVSPRSTFTLYGFFTGLVGVAVLALHCPILNSLHILVWHLGAMLLAGLAGFFVGSYASR